MIRARPQYSAIARQLLADDHAGGEPEKTACADSAASVFERLEKRLAPLIGIAGMRALFARAIKLTTGQFALLEQLRSASLKDDANLAESLSDVLNRTDAGAAWKASTALYANFLELTSSLIGEHLVLLVLQHAFPKLDVTAKQESE